MTDQKKTFELQPVAEERIEFLKQWLWEHQLGQKIENESEEPNSVESEPITECDGTITPFDFPIRPGEVRLLSGRVLKDYTFTYLAVLDVVGAEGRVVVAPFSDYSVPATKDELLTPFDGTPVKALQLWNTFSMSIFQLSQSWCCFTMTADELNSAKKLYQHFLSGTYPPLDLRNRTGLPIYKENDPRLDYQRLAFEYFQPLRTAMDRQHFVMERTRQVVASSREESFALASASTTFSLNAISGFVGKNATYPIELHVVGTDQVIAIIASEKAGKLQVRVFDQTGDFSNALDSYRFATMDGTLLAEIKNGNALLSLKEISDGAVLLNPTFEMVELQYEQEGN